VDILGAFAAFVVAQFIAKSTPSTLMALVASYIQHNMSFKML